MDSFDSFLCPVLMYFEVEEKEREESRSFSEKLGDYFIGDLDFVRALPSHQVKAE